jgi:hypothetical protein
MSEVVFHEMRRGRLTPDDARAILVTVARRHAAKLELVATVDRTLETPEPMSGEHADRISGVVYRLLAERGGSLMDPSIPTGCAPAGSTLPRRVRSRPFWISIAGRASCLQSRRACRA